MQGRQDPRARRAAMALAVVAKGTGSGGMGHRPISLGSLVDRLHFSLAWPEAAGIFEVASQAYLQLTSFPSHNQTGRMRRSRMEKSLPQ